jgi:hypothetical protein
MPTRNGRNHSKQSPANTASGNRTLSHRPAEITVVCQQQTGSKQPFEVGIMRCKRDPAVEKPPIQADLAIDTLLLLVECYEKAINLARISKNSA